MTDIEKRLMDCLVLFMILGVPPGLIAQNKRQLEAQYKNKYAVVLKDGLAIGVCDTPLPNSTPIATITNSIDHGVADYLHQHGTFLRPLAPSYGCAKVAAEPIHKGEVVFIERAFIMNVYGRRFELTIRNASPHGVSRGVGVFEHQSLESGQAEILFPLDEKDDAKEPAQAALLAREWFRLFDELSLAEADSVSFGNTASGALVKEIKIGMTAAEVEAVLGPPQMKVDLADKILYKYRDMTVEFRDNKVSDVR